MIVLMLFKRDFLKEGGNATRIRNYPKKQVMALPVVWRNKTARSPDCVASIVIASRLPYHHFNAHTDS